MFNNKLKNLFIVLFLLTSLTLVNGCSSKPAEDVMKGIIAKTILDSPYVKFEEYSNINFKEFKIINSFNKKIDGVNWYCIEVNFKFSCDGLGRTWDVERNKSQWSFVKSGKEWSGKNNWPK